MTGIEWSVDPVLFHAGPVAVHAYSLLFAAAFLVGLPVLAARLSRLGVPVEVSAGLALVSFLTVVVGTRLAHVVFYEPQAASRLLDTRGGGLASHGAAVALLVVPWLFARWRRIEVLDVLDAFALPVAVGAGLVRLGNLANSEILGRETTVPWGFHFARLGDDVLRHPVQLYEAALCFAVAGVVLWAMRRGGLPRGRLAALLLALYFGGRLLVIEWFKDEGRLSSWLTTGQLLSLPFAVLGLVLLVRSRTPGVSSAPPLAAAGSPSR
jgi:prolipoprotein diacylglyceryl transferase